MGGEKPIKSVAVIGAGASGAVTASALKAENYFDTIKVFERRESAGGTWIFDPNPGPELPVRPGKLPPDVDPPLDIPNVLPKTTAPCEQERFSRTPVYNTLTTNVPDIAMCFSDLRFSYGPFPPHHIPRQYLENYFALHSLDKHLVLSTTVEDVSRIPPPSGAGRERWKLTLRKHDVLRGVDHWWSEEFDALVIANGHYSVPYIPHVDGLDEYIQKYPDKVVHSKHYRSPSIYKDLKVLTIGNSASGWDITNELKTTAHLPVYNSRRHRSPFDGPLPAPGIAWKPVITRYDAPTGTIFFDDGTTLGAKDVDRIIYCTGYRPSFPFWNVAANGRPLYDYDRGRLVGSYWHTFFRDFPSTLAIVGIQRALTFRSFEYQAVAVARWFAGRNVLPLPSTREMERWEKERDEEVARAGRPFHDVQRAPGGMEAETFEFLGWLYRLAGLGTLRGDGRVPPVLGRDVLWALKNVHKYPRHDLDSDSEEVQQQQQQQQQEVSPTPSGAVEGEEWVLVTR